MIAYLTMSLGLIVLTAAFTVVHLGFALTFALLMIVVSFSIALCVGLYLFLSATLKRFRLRSGEGF